MRQDNEKAPGGQTPRAIDPGRDQHMIDRFHKESFDHAVDQAEFVAAEMQKLRDSKAPVIHADLKPRLKGAIRELDELVSVLLLR